MFTKRKKYLLFSGRGVYSSVFSKCREENQKMGKGRKGKEEEVFLPFSPSLI